MRTLFNLVLKRDDQSNQALRKLDRMKLAYSRRQLCAESWSVKLYLSGRGRLLDRIGVGHDKDETSVVITFEWTQR